MKIVVSTLCNRPDYTRQMVEALANCHGAEDYTFMAFVEPGWPEVLEPLRQARDGGWFKECTWQVNEERLYVRRNMQQALAAGFTRSDRVIVLEDDCIPAPDALRYFEWALERYKDDGDVFSVTGYHRPGGPGRSAEEWAGYAQSHGAVVRRRCWFHPSGWATWARNWAWIAGQWALPGRHYDRHLMGLMRRYGLFEIYPALPRIKNIGVEGGTSSSWLTPEQYRKMHGNETSWAGNWALPKQQEWIER